MIRLSPRESRGGGAPSPQKKEDIGESGIINLSTKELSKEELVTFKGELNIKRYLLSNFTRQLVRDASVIVHLGLSNASLFNPQEI